MPTIYERFFQLSADPQCIVDYEGRIEAVNGAFASCLGYSASDLNATLLFDLAHADDRARLAHEHAQAQKGHQSGLACQLRRKDGTHRKLLLRAMPSLADARILFIVRSAAMDIHNPSSQKGPFMSLLMKQLAGAVEMEHAFIFKWINSPVTRVQTLAACIDGQIIDEPLEFPIAGTPCEIVTEGRSCYFTEGLPQQFPEDEFVVDYKTESYLGIPFLNPAGEILGHICTFSKKKLTPEDAERKLALLSGFAQQVSAELDRLRAEEAFGQVMLATAVLSGPSLFRELARHIAEACQARFAIIAEYVDQPPAGARKLAVWPGEDWDGDARLDDIAGTPGERMARGETYSCAGNVRQAYPDDRELAALAVKSYYGVPLLDAAGHPIGYIAVMDAHLMGDKEHLHGRLQLFSARVASELLRVRSERSASAHARRYQLVMENVADPLFVYDRQGRIVEVNRAAERCLGVAHDQLVGSEIGRFQVDAGAAWIGVTFDALQDGAQALDAVLRRADGSTFPVEIRLARVDLEGRELVLATARDTTERKRIEELSEANLQALSTPIIEVWDGIVALPVIGHVARDRAVRMMQTLLDVITAKRAELAIIDLTGVTSVDAATASHLLDIARSVALLGSRCHLSGISADVARSLVSLDADVRGLRIFGTLQSALRHGIAERSRR